MIQLLLNLSTYYLITETNNLHHNDSMVGDKQKEILYGKRGGQRLLQRVCHKKPVGWGRYKGAIIASPPADQYIVLAATRSE